MTETSQQQRGGGLVDLSPIKRDDDGNKENAAAVLSLVQFSRAPVVLFGAVRLGSSRSALLRVENPSEDTVAEVTVERVCSAKGFSSSHHAFTIQVRGGLLSDRSCTFMCDPNYFMSLGKKKKHKTQIQHTTCSPTFSYYATHSWNKVPEDLRLAPTLTTFMFTLAFC